MNTASYYHHHAYLNDQSYKKPPSNNSDESGCEADMAEGGQEDDSGDVASMSPHKLDAGDAPLNLKSEGSEDSNPPSPDQYPVQRELPTNGGMPSIDTKIPNDSVPVSNSKPGLDSKTAEMVQHLLMMNGHHDNKMAALQSFQNLQNLATGLQNLNSVSSLVAGLQSLTGLQTMPSPLQNLTAPTQNLLNTPLNLSLGATGTNGLLGNHSNPSSILNPSQGPQMPQFILASGQLVQGIQGANLLIPTSQGIATQTILTIPVNHVTSNQMVNVALNNGQVVTTTLAQLQSLAQPHMLSAPSSSPVGPTSNLLGLSGLPTHQQQLLNAMQQQPQLVSHSLLNSLSTSNPTVKSPVHRTHHSYSSSCDKMNGSNNPVVTSSSSNNGTSNGCITSSAMSTISRLAASNSDITITPTPAPAHQMRPCDSDSFRRDRSESPMSDGCDLLDDSPNEPMISEVQSNVVDGINLDEMKEFAKAFKLRRLSLGLTQTQVGQALSVTEGPAYSQSAICSALASRVLCAATRQQTVFEKLDITPKSAQKIKPVLERWMKEAEERFKSGQNHLTEFIGMEPSKKRKRRTSFTPQALELLNVHFERNTHPSGTEITALAHQLGYEREVIRIWFCNKRQALKNTVRMMSKAGG